MMLTSELPATSPETFEQIEIGMSERDVLRIVRASPGWYGGDNRLPFSTKNYKRLPLICGTVGTTRLQTHSRKATIRPILRSGMFGEQRRKIRASNSIKKEQLAMRSRIPSGYKSTHPERWPWWKRLLNRETPGPEPARFYGPF